MANFTLKVIELRQETADSVTICFKQPTFKKIKYLPGQYLTLVFRINGRQYIRPYSLSSCPGVDQNLEITVKRIFGGTVSNHICDNVMVGDLIEVMEPMGDFVVNESELVDDGHIYFWGVGSGITPLFSIIKYLLNHTKVNATLIYGNRDLDSTIFLHQLNTLLEQFPVTFSVWHFLTRSLGDENKSNILHGRIGVDRLYGFWRDRGGFRNTKHYICGPRELKESIKAALSHLDVRPEDILTEDFELVKNESDFAGLITRNVQLRRADLEISVEVVKGKTILEACLDALIEIPYSCQVGNCMVCRGRLIEGEVKYIGIERKPDKLEIDECLLCCIHPLSDDVRINVDYVIN